MHRCLGPTDHQVPLRPRRCPALLAAALLLACSASALAACAEHDVGLAGVDCEDPTVEAGAPCAREDAVCEWADDCGGETLECQGGVWIATEERGCAADPVPCTAAPGDLDACDHDSTCDPDGDCRDVLECASYTWRAYAVCSEEYCPAAAPVPGKACDSEERACDVEHPCGSRLFSCLDGWWHFIGGAICTDPVACADVPVENDACATPGDVC
ncbi:MAG TPA: hypothetical protein VKB80_28040, partial [Kofleriaceae bacterium]|nr:hypothetical protein [Kofleriaceae bacterium]